MDIDIASDPCDVVFYAIPSSLSISNIILYYLVL